MCSSQSTLYIDLIHLSGFRPFGPFMHLPFVLTQEIHQSIPDHHLIPENSYFHNSCGKTSPHFQANQGHWWLASSMYAFQLLNFISLFVLGFFSNAVSSPSLINRDSAVTFYLKWGGLSTEEDMPTRERKYPLKDVVYNSSSSQIILRRT